MKFVRYSFLLLFLIFGFSGLTQPGPPGGSPPGQGNGNGKCPNCAPIDTDIWLLVMGGVAIGGTSIFKKKRHSELFN